MSEHPQNLPVRQTLGHVPPPWVNPAAILFITICTLPRGENQLCHSTSAGQLFEAVHFRMQRQTWHGELILLTPDHLHALFAFPATIDLRKAIADFKEMTAKRTGIRWQRDFFDHRLRAREQLQLKAHYIRQNPVRTGLTPDAATWPDLHRIVPKMGQRFPEVDLTLNPRRSYSFIFTYLSAIYD